MPVSLRTKTKISVLLGGLVLFFCLSSASAFALNSPPSVGTITPSSGTSLPNQAVSFTTTYTDPDGYKDILYAHLLINNAINGANSFYAYYNPYSNLFYLRNDANTLWLGGFAPGSANTIENSYVKLDCSKTSVSGSGTTLSITWNITFKPTFIGTKNTYLYVKDNSLANTGWVQKGTWTINTPPQVGTITPASGTSLVNAPVNFTTTYIDADGWQNILYVHLLINKVIDGRNCFYGYYNQNSNLLYIRDDANANWLGGFIPGSANAIENSYVKLDCSKTTVSGTGTTLTVNWNVTFKSSFMGSKNSYLYVKDQSGANTGWVQKGTWTIADSPPTVGTITPSSGTSLPNQAVSFTTTYTDPDGYKDILYAHLLINNAINGANSFYAYYNPYSNLLYIRNDANTIWLGGYAPGSANIIENSYIKLDCSKSTVSGSGTTLTITWNITFKPTFIGAKNTYLYVKDNSLANTGWIQKGTWTINTPPQVGTITPASGSSSVDTPVNFTTTYTDPNGWQDILYVHLLINNAIDGRNCFYGYYNQNTNLLYIRDDTNANWLGGFAPGSANTIENSYAKLDCSKSTISGSGTTLTVNWNITFKSTVGTKNTYLYVKDDFLAFNGWVQKGTWTINNSAPAVGTITPVNGSSLVDVPVTFTTTYTDPNGWQDIQYVHLLINTAITGLNSFYGYYNQNTNLLYLRNDANTEPWLGGFAPGSSNIIENSYAKLDCSKTTISGSGTTLTVNWNVTFKPTFTGAKNSYLYVKDDSLAYNGWTQKGTWTITAQGPSLEITSPQEGQVIRE